MSQSPLVARTGLSGIVVDQLGGAAEASALAMSGRVDWADCQNSPRTVREMNGSSLNPKHPYKNGAKLDFDGKSRKQLEKTKKIRALRRRPRRKPTMIYASRLKKRRQREPKSSCAFKSRKKQLEK